MLIILIAKSEAKMQNIDTYFYPDPPVVGQPLTIYLNGVICKFVSLVARATISMYHLFNSDVIHVS